MIFRGTATALITPFRRGKPDLQAFSNLIEAQLAAGVEGLVVLGTTGEAATMSDDDKTAVLKQALAVAKGKTALIAGTGCNCTARTVERTRTAFELGYDAALVVTPYYNKPTQAGLKAHYGALDACKAGPILMYHVPGRTGGKLDLQTVVDLAAGCPNVAGLKDAGGDCFFSDSVVRFVKTLRPDFALYSGNDDSAFHLVCSGGDGVISVVSNLAPKLTGDMIRATLAGDLAHGRSLHLKLLDLAKDLFIETSPGPVKYGASLLGFGDGSLALPLVPPDEATCTRIKADLMELDLL